MVTLHKLSTGVVLSPAQLKGLREHGGLHIAVVLTIDAESVYKSMTSSDLTPPTEKPCWVTPAGCESCLTSASSTHFNGAIRAT